jgi:hypothetical protein
MSWHELCIRINESISSKTGGDTPGRCDEKN